MQLINHKFRQIKPSSSAKCLILMTIEEVANHLQSISLESMENTKPKYQSKLQRADSNGN